MRAIIPTFGWISTNDGFVDLINERFDAGIRFWRCGTILI